MGLHSVSIGQQEDTGSCNDTLSYPVPVELTYRNRKEETRVAARFFPKMLNWSVGDVKSENGGDAHKSTVLQQGGTYVHHFVQVDRPTSK